MEEIKEKGYLLENYRLFHLKDDLGTSCTYHYHEFHKIVFLLAGSGAYTVDGTRYALSPGDIVFVGSRVVHRPDFVCGHPYERIILYVSPDFLTARSSPDCDLAQCFSGVRGHLLHAGENSQKTIERKFQTIENLISDCNRFGNKILSDCALIELLLELNRLMLECRIPVREISESYDSKIRDIRIFIDENLFDDISADLLSEKFYISKYHLMRRFHAQIGEPIHAYISARRLLAAREAIRTGSSATEACFACGFKSYAAFARAYSRIFGITPTGRPITASRAAETEE